MYNQTIIEPLALILTISMSILVIIIKREYIIFPLIVIACIITKSQRFVIFTIDFPMLRIILICVFIRIFTRHEITSMHFNKIDKFIIIWSISRIITHTILTRSFGGFSHAAGELMDTLGTYFAVRCAIYNLKDYDIIIKSLIIVSIPVAIFMIYEQTSGGRNVFSIFGGVPEFNLIRQGKLRSQGAFNHPIMAGTFGASMIPLIWALWQKRKILFTLIGITAALIITFTSSSSGPVVTLACGLFGIIFWKFRKQLKNTIRLGIVVMILMQIVMKVPIWHLIARIDLVGGSTGYHRFILIDSAITRFYEWILFGIRSTAHWGFGMGDITNMYIYEGAYGGIVPLILFITIIKHSFKNIGLAKKVFEKNEIAQKYSWALGATLFAHVVSFIAVSYFGQMIFFYYLHIAMISCLSNLPEFQEYNTQSLKDKPL